MARRRATDADVDRLVQVALHQLPASVQRSAAWMQDRCRDGARRMRTGLPIKDPPVRLYGIEYEDVRPYHPEDA